MKYYSFIFVLYLIRTKANFSSLIEKSASLTNEVFNKFVISVVWSQDKEPDEVISFIKLLRGAVILTTIGRDTDNDTIRELQERKVFLQTVLIATDTCEVEYFMAVLYDYVVQPIHFIAVILKPIGYNEMARLMRAALESDVADIILVSPNTEWGEDISVSTYFRYRKGKCDDFTPVQLNPKEKIIFPKKFRNFHGCEIRSTFRPMTPYLELKFTNDTVTSIAGIDGNIINILFDILNAKMFVTSAEERDGLGIIINGTATGSLADLMLKQSDIMVPALFMTENRYPYIQFYHAVNNFKFVWVGPRLRRISGWLQIIHPVKTKATLALFVTSIIFVIVTIGISHVKNKAIPVDRVLFYSFNVFLGVEIKIETKYSLVNSLFVMWIWFCMVVRIAYLGDLVEHMQTVPMETPLRTFKTAVTQVDAYGGIKSTRDTIFNNTVYFKDYKVIPNVEFRQTLKDVENGKRLLLVADERICEHVAPNLQILHQDPITQGFVSFHMRPSWPAALEVDHTILRMMENGLIDKVLREHQWETGKLIDKIDSGAKSLTLEILIGYLYVLGVMYGVCFLFFIVENIYHRINYGRRV